MDVITLERHDQKDISLNLTGRKSLLRPLRMSLQTGITLLSLFFYVLLFFRLFRLLLHVGTEQLGTLFFLSLGKFKSGTFAKEFVHPACAVFRRLPVAWCIIQVVNQLFFFVFWVSRGVAFTGLPPYS